MSNMENTKLFESEEKILDLLIYLENFKMMSASDLPFRKGETTDAYPVYLKTPWKEIGFNLSGTELDNSLTVSEFWKEVNNSSYRIYLSGIQKDTESIEYDELFKIKKIIT